MAVESNNDRISMLEDFGVLAQLTLAGQVAKQITVLFDNEFFSVDVGAGVDITSLQPTAMALTEDMVGAKRDDPIVINNTNYTVQVLMPDGEGFTEVMLELQD
jgi:hypothetical protein